MRFTYAESMCDPAHYLPLARAAEAAGFSGMTVPDSICYPAESDSTYPYTGDGQREFLEDKPFIEPFVLIPAMAAVTQRLRFDTFVVKLPVRQPVLVAKQAMSVAVMSGNRFGFGVGLSPWPEDYTVTGTAWPARGRRLDEMIEIVRGLSTGDYFEYHGDFYDIPKIKMCPAPTIPIPILIGGHSDAALRRAARLGDGWMHAGGDGAELERLIGRIRALREECGRADRPFEIHVISVENATPEGVARLAELGVTSLVMPFRNPYDADVQSLDEKIDLLGGFGEAVIAQV